MIGGGLGAGALVAAIAMFQCSLVQDHRRPNGKKSEACGEGEHGITQAAIGQGTRGRSQPSLGHPSCQNRETPIPPPSA